MLQYLYHAGIFAFKYPTSGRYSTKSKAWIKTRGTITGVSDIIAILHNGVTLWIEVKTATGRQTANQKEFQLKLESRGHTYIIVRSVDDLIDFLNTQQA